MKLTKIFLLAGIAAAGVLASCSDDDYEKGAVATGNQLQAVTFGPNNIYTAELDPADPTTHTITLYRDSAYMAEAASVPLKVITNDDDVFVAPATAEFAAGSAETTITVTFNAAEVGVPYNFEIAIDDSYVHPYSSDTYSRYAITNLQRVKWNSLGLVEFYDTMICGRSDGSTWGYYVELQQRDGTNMFRLIEPYAGANANEDDWGGGLYQSDEKIFFTILNAGDVDDDGDEYLYVTFDTWATGYWYQDAYMVYAFLPSDLSASIADDDELSVYYPDYGQIILTPYYYIPGLGGFGEYSVYIIIPEETPAGAVAGGIVPEASAKSRGNIREATPVNAIRPSDRSLLDYKWKRY